MIVSYLRRYPFTFLLVVVIFLLSLLPMPDMRVGEEVPFADKWTHMAMYAALTLAIWFDYKRSHRCYDARRLLLFAFLAPIVMGGVLELMQANLTSCRSGEWADFAANAVGVFVGTALGVLLKVSKRH